MDASAGNADSLMWASRGFSHETGARTGPLHPAPRLSRHCPSGRAISLSLAASAVHTGPMGNASSSPRRARRRLVAGGGLVRGSALVVVTALLGGCHIQQRVTLPGASPVAAAPLVQPGDQVRIRLKDGTTITATLVEVGPAELVTADGLHIAATDIGQIEKRQISSERTTLLVVGIVAGALLLIVAAATAAAYSSFLGG